VVLEVYTHGELIRTGAGNCDAFINYKLVAGQRDGLPFQRYINNADNVIETHQHAGELRELESDWLSLERLVGLSVLIC
jgi:hypothetical protein